MDEMAMTRWKMILPVLLLIGGCLPSRQIGRQCNAELQAKLVGEEEFPPGWNMSKSEKDRLYNSGSIDQCSVYFSVENAGSFQEVYEYTSIGNSARGYEHLREVAFEVNQDHDTKWDVPSNMSIEDIQADEYFVACSDFGDRIGCQLLARYKQFVVLFFSHMATDTMTIESFEQVIYSIDQRMGG